jgi:hypothetical protein
MTDSQVHSRIIRAFVFLALAGCTTTSSVRPAQLERLDGYDVRRVPFVEPVLDTIDGNRVAVGADSKLFLELPGGRVGGRFAAIDVHDGVFEGHTEDARPIQAPLEEVRAVVVERPDNAGTGLAIGAAVLAAAGILALVLYSTSGQTQAVPGRPLRVRGKPVAAPVIESEGWRRLGVQPAVSSLSAAARAALADAWNENARSEHASVPAFSRLSLTLVSLGAPADLVERAHRAALEEIEHARLAFALAGAYADERVAPGALPELRGSPAVTAGSLSELASESLVDGCLNEGFSAAAARAASALASDACVRDAWAEIARDEASHAELAWDIVRWCLAGSARDLGRRLQQTIHTVARSVSASAQRVSAHLEPELQGHGWLPPATLRDMFEETRLAVASRLAVLVSSQAIS